MLPTFPKCFWTLCCSVLLTIYPSVLVASADDGEVLFNRDIRPILVAHCVACHGGVKQAADLSFSYPERVLPPEGWVIEPGSPAESELIQRVESDDPDLRMPPPEHGRALTNDEIQLLTNWIAQGAHWQRHWAFEKPIAHSTPPVSDPSWPRSKLDYFVLAGLDNHDLPPSPDAEPNRWLRRVTLDLIGLPPTLDELNAFLDEYERDGELAYEHAIDRLLASEHLGERWASVWLDQVRYADSMGLGLDAQRTIWKYRDWVIRAFNTDMPYDQFTIKQIAGDLLPGAQPIDLIATAGHRLTQSNAEGGTDDEEFRIAAVLDRVNTTWQTWQGVTFGCTQCHSHPYEPIENKEYYQFAAFFNNTADCDLDSDAPRYAAPKNPADYSKAAKLDQEIELLEASIWQEEYRLLMDDVIWTGLTGMRASASKATKVEVEQRDHHDEFRTVGTVAKDTDITVEAELPESTKDMTAFRVTGMPLDPAKAIPDSEWGFVWSQVEAELLLPGSPNPKPLSIARVLADELHPFQNPQESLNAKSKQGFGAFSRIHYPRSAAFVLTDPIKIPAGAKLRVKLSHRNYLLAAFSLVTRRGRLAVSDDPGLTDLATAPQWKEQRQRLADLKKHRSEIPAIKTPVLRELPAHLARPSYVFMRGLFLDKGEQVSPGVPSSWPKLETTESPDRLTLAHWLVSAENPLTARVAVNRIWAQLFGVGIVETEEDFGSSGEPPSHPELLDDLAVSFQNEFNWSVKKLLREIVLSRTYRQSSVLTDTLLQKDLANRLLAHGPRHRLPAETIRDQALAIAGLLNKEMFGPPVRPPIPAGVWNPFDGGDKWPSAESGAPTRYRRSIYTYMKRSIPYPMHATFDQPSREFCTPRRLRSNTPLQALEMLNSESFVECAATLAERMRAHSKITDEQLAYGFQLAVCRLPNDAELAALHELYDQRTGDQGLNAVAAAILNLDELVTK